MAGSLLPADAPDPGKSFSPELIIADKNHGVIVKETHNNIKMTWIDTVDREKQ